MAVRAARAIYQVDPYLFRDSNGAAGAPWMASPKAGLPALGISHVAAAVLLMPAVTVATMSPITIASIHAWATRPRSSAWSMLPTHAVWASSSSW